jgi:hypothetical protein
MDGRRDSHAQLLALELTGHELPRAVWDVVPRHPGAHEGP